jgi:DNA-binding CsgD family transcriptional regulator
MYTIKAKEFFVFFSVWVLYSFLSILYAQELPPINAYSPLDYSAESQNWSITQSDDNTIYIANNKGLLEFNGANWHLYESPNKTKLRSVKFIDSLIYSGSYHEFGYWERDGYGHLIYTSLSEKLNVDFLEDEEIWNIMHLENTLLFQSLNRIHIYNIQTNSYNTIDSKSTISSLFKVDENFYFQDVNNGLFKIENGKGILVFSDIVINSNTIVNVFSEGDKLLLLTQDSGFFILNEEGLTHWNDLDNSIFDDVSVFSAIKMRDGGYALGTISDGVIFISKSGDVLYHINQSKGLLNNTVLSLFEDADMNIWLGLDYGINNLNINSPYKIYNDTNGEIGSVYTTKVFDNNIYLGTNQGLFFKSLDSDESFSFVTGTQGQVWSLEIIDNTLFCGHHSGTFVVNKNRADKISNVQGTWKLAPIARKPNLILQGNYYGLHVLEKQNDINWVYRNKIEGFNISSRFFEIVNEDEIFVNHEYKGLFRLKVNESFNKVEEFFIDPLVEKGLYSSLLNHNKEVLYANRNGVFKYNRKDRVFVLDSLLSSLISYEDFTSARLISEPETNKLWSVSSRDLKYLVNDNLSNQGKINVINFPISIRKDVIGYENITHISDERFLFGTSKGYIVINVNNMTKHNQEISIDNISYGELKEDNLKLFVDLSLKNIELNSTENNLHIEYSIPEFDNTRSVEYQYQLKGKYDDWSDWSSSSDVYFENLPFGDYSFNIRGRIGEIETTNTATINFTIKRPWYLSNTFLILYSLVIILLSIIIHNTYKRYYRRQRLAIIQKSERELELKELENKQQLMRFNNDKLRQDIESKSRELGMSTMNLIKKNELLNSIKKELKKTDETNKIRNVLRIIDNNLNDKDDWHVFENAFNNADKGFLQKIKSLHTELTSNDLRLCAYLRLNLSSKEIAPLLNISPRSVEVKRYRLRKKMNLPHEANLTTYILEV